MRSASGPPAAPVASEATDVLDTSFTANWAAVAGATGYRLDVSTVSNFASFVTGYEDKTVSGTSQSVTGLTAGTTYYYRVRAVNAGSTSGNSDTIQHFDFTANTWVATDGNDSTGDGTFAAPYATIAKAESLTLTGTKATIYMKAGTYTEAIELSKAYTWKAYGSVTWRSSGTNQVVKGKGSTVNNWTLDGIILDGQTTATSIVNTSTGSTGTVTMLNCQFINPKDVGYGIRILNTLSPEIVATGCSFTGKRGGKA